MKATPELVTSVVQTTLDRLNQTLTPHGTAGTPTSNQLQQINAYIPRGMPPLINSDVYTISIVVADNLLNRSYAKWPVAELNTMADLIQGVPATLDHDDLSVDKTWGRIYDARVLQNPNPPESLIHKSGNADINQQIVMQEGYHLMVADAFIAVDHPRVKDMHYARMGEVSLGGFRISDMICPLCDTSFFNSECPHYIPGSFAAMFEADEDEIAPYYLRAGLFDVMELSLVLTPNAPGAQVIKTSY